MNRLFCLAIIVFSTCFFSSSLFADIADTEKRIRYLLSQMTLEEKIGQLNQYSNPDLTTGHLDDSVAVHRAKLFKQGRVGSVLNVLGVEKVRAMQKAAVEETRLGIPLIFAFDVIHGYRTIFPIPLAESASWDLNAIELAAKVAAAEASAAGVNWTFAPMVDIARNPLWGRIMEGAGEDPYLGGVIAEARVKGFQGTSLESFDTIAACAKHFVAYGEVRAGRDYNNVDISERELREVHLPPFHAAAKANVATFMNAFNEINGVPASGNRYIMRDILRGEWDFNGVVVSDWDSYGGMITSGVAANKVDAARMALEGGSDIDMEADVYTDGLPEIIKKGIVNEKRLDEAVARVLRLKFKLGLFEDPYRYLDETREKNVILAPHHLQIARDVARKSIVLLKNEETKTPSGKRPILPLDYTVKNIAVIGPLADDKENMNGFWKGAGEAEDVTTLLTGIKQRARKGTNVEYAKGSELHTTNNAMLEEAVNLAEKSDIIILAVGEEAVLTGEAASRTNLDLYPAQKRLAQALHDTGKPIVMVLMNGRPLTINWSAEHIPSIVEAWFLGSQAGPAISDVLFGDYNPSGKLTVSFPRNTGQIPIYYNHKRVSRPLNKDERWTSKYVDSPNSPLFPFGFGLSYSDYEYSGITLSKKQFKNDETITAEVSITNKGRYAGSEVVQMYIQDMVGSVVRTVKDLRGFEKVTLAPNETKVVRFTLSEDTLKFFTQDMSYKAESGEFKVMIGPNSETFDSTGFTYSKK